MMNATKFIKDSERTDLKMYSDVAGRCNNNETVRLLHAAMGLSTEANEILDAMKKNLFYGKPIDKVNMCEEVGDVLWYVAIICRLYGISMEEIMQGNINKLRVRFPEKFTEEAAQVRDLETERAQLERDYIGG